MCCAFFENKKKKKEKIIKREQIEDSRETEGGRKRKENKSGEGREKKKTEERRPRGLETAGPWKEECWKRRRIKEERKREGKNKETGTRACRNAFAAQKLAFEILTLRQFSLDAFAEWRYRRCGYECIVRWRARALLATFSPPLLPQFSV